jgi:UDP-2,3-diacylglucosamine hydrolase
MIALAAKTKDRRADSVISAIINEGVKDGLTVVENPPYLKNILATEGVLTKKAPSKQQLQDIELGKEIALNSGGLDIGQTAIINKHAVVAVEAMEGTDRCIIRAGEIIKNNVIVKMAKPNQDFRFDVPCFGTKTIKKMIDSKSSLLAVEANKTYFLEKEKTIELANKNKIVIVGINR